MFYDFERKIKQIKKKLVLLGLNLVYFYVIVSIIEIKSFLRTLRNFFQHHWAE